MLDRLKIPQWADYDKDETNYLNDVKSMVDLIRQYERAKQLIKDWGKYWRIVHVPVDDPAVDNNIDETGHLTLSGVSLKTWLDYHLISQTKAAELCGVTSRTFRRWIAGKPPIPNSALELLRSKIIPEKK